MDRPRGAPARWREGLVLALGLLSAALLGGAALAPFSDPELAGRAAFAQLAGRVEDGVVAEWERLLGERSIPGIPLASWTGAEAARSGELLPEAAPVALKASLTAFDVLLGEALRLEAAGNPAQARVAVLEALDKQAPPARRGLARLLAIRVARSLQDCETARAQWATALDELEGAESSDGVPTLVACALAVAPCLEEGERSAAQEHLVGLWTSGNVALAEGAMRAVLCERVVELAAASEAARRLRAHERVRELALLARALPGGRLPERPADSSWHLRADPGREELIAWRAEDADGVVASAVTLPELVAALEARVHRNELVPSGFRLDFGLHEEPQGEPVRERRELAEGVLGLTLRHVDPQSVVRAEGGRLVLLRLALLGVALATLGASVATFRALRRERRLAELKSAFVANVSHELRTPLASILMLAENLEAGRVDDEAGRARYHALIRREAERPHRLVADVLDFSRLERGNELELRREELDVDALARSLREEALGWARSAGFELALDVEPAAGSVKVDPDALRRAVVNLLENARKHSGERAGTLDLHVVPGELVIGVEDQGRGVPEASRAAIFEPFARLDRRDGAAGTGLGLAIVREIALAHGGDVTLRAGTGGRGARFELRLPLLHEAGTGVTA